MGVETSDDAAIYRITDEIAMIQTVDFFTPIVDDPFLFGQIAAANSLSDIYAMGGTPKLALNVVGFPNCLDPGILGDILVGGASKVKEAGAVLAGGHSVQDEEPKYGLCVTGFVHPEKIWRNYGAIPGDVLILTKPIGNGIINTALKAEVASAGAVAAAQEAMVQLNSKARMILEHYPVHACTDVTGFGLMGHGVEMAEGSRVSLIIDAGQIPYLPDALEYAQMGLIPAGAYKNRNYFGEKVDLNGCKEAYADIMFDPQTSGGLLVSVARESAFRILKEFEQEGLGGYVSAVGYVSAEEDKSIIIM